MNLNFKQVLVPALSAAVGALATLGALKLTDSSEKKNEPARDGLVFDWRDDDTAGLRSPIDILNDQLFDPNNIFDQMPMATFNNLGVAKIQDVLSREDESFFFYEIEVGDVNSTSVQTKVENGMITIIGTSKREHTSDKTHDRQMSTQSSFQSTFTRTFSVPENVDENKMQMTFEGDKIVLKFPKTRT